MLTNLKYTRESVSQLEEIIFSYDYKQSYVESCFDPNVFILCFALGNLPQQKYVYKTIIETIGYLIQFSLVWR